MQLRWNKADFVLWLKAKSKIERFISLKLRPGASTSASQKLWYSRWPKSHQQTTLSSIGFSVISSHLRSTKDCQKWIKSIWWSLNLLHSDGSGGWDANSARIGLHVKCNFTSTVFPDTDQQNRLFVLDGVSERAEQVSDSPSMEPLEVIHFLKHMKSRGFPLGAIAKQLDSFEKFDKYGRIAKLLKRPR